MDVFFAILRRDMKLASYAGGGAFLTLGFFALMVVMMPLGVGRDLALLSSLAPGLIWLSAALAALLALDRLYQADVDDGSLDQFLLSGLPLELIALSKTMALWIATVLPIVILAPVMGILFNLEGSTVLSLTVALLLGTPAFCFAGSIAAAITAGLRRGGLLLSVLALPLFVPTLIFGAAASLSLGAELYFLGAITLLSAVVSPFASAAALRLHAS